MFGNLTMELLMMYCYGVRKIQEIIKQKPCEDAQAKFTLNELLLEGQGFRMFLQLKTAVTEKILPGDAQGPMRVTQKSYWMTIDKFKATAFKTKAARYQGNCYLHKNLYRPSNVLIRACFTRLEEKGKSKQDPSVITLKRQIKRGKGQMTLTLPVIVRMSPVEPKSFVASVRQQADPTGLTIHQNVVDLST